MTKQAKTTKQQIRELSKRLNYADKDWDNPPDGGFDIGVINEFLDEYQDIARDYQRLTAQYFKELHDANNR
jgi:hypothetical protein